MGHRSILAMLVILSGASAAVAAADASSYAGVNPDSETSENLPPKAEDIPEGVLMLTWPGFLMHEDGSSSFFVQTSGPVKVVSHKSEGRFELVLRNTRVHLKNTFLPLETQFFRTPVTRASVQRRGPKDVAMILELREDVTPTVTQKKGKDGFNYVFVQLAP